MALDVMSRYTRHCTHPMYIHDASVKAMIKSEMMRNTLAPAHTGSTLLCRLVPTFSYFSYYFFEIAMLSGGGGYRYFAVVVENQAKTNEYPFHGKRRRKKNICGSQRQRRHTNSIHILFFSSVDTIAKYRKRKLGENCSNKKEVKRTIEFCSPHTHTTVHKMKLQNIETEAVPQYQSGGERSKTDVRVDVSSFAINMWVVNAEEGKLRKKNTNKVNTYCWKVLLCAKKITLFTHVQSTSYVLYVCVCVRARNINEYWRRGKCLVLCMCRKCTATWEQ